MSQDIDESIVKDVGEYVPFLDIQFCFNKDGDLQTDLYIKPTDARSYLNYTPETRILGNRLLSMLAPSANHQPPRSIEITSR